MRALSFSTSLFAFVSSIHAQQIYDIYTTSRDQSQLFTYTNLGNSPINFVSPGSIGDADIVVDDTQVFQTIVGHGASLTDSSATMLGNLKNSNPSAYSTLLDQLFDPTDGNKNAGLTYLRVPLGASDFSASAYTYDDVSGDTSLSHFDITKTPSNVFSVINDIKGVNPYLKVHLLPWSPPGWMKDSGSINGGNFLDQYETTYANYLLKALQGFKSKGITAYAIGIQNEPENSNPTYPTCAMTATQEAKIGTTLRSLMDANGFSSTRIIGYEHNWKDAGGFPVQLMQQAQSAFAGVSFHDYSGSVSQQDTFHNAFPSKEIYFTEGTGSFGSDWWSDVKWYMDNLYIGATEHNAMAVLMWNIALDGNGHPELSSSNSCNPACRPIVTISGSGYTLNQEFYAMAQASKAIVPKDSNGPFGQRISVSVGGSLDWGLRVGAYVTARTNPSDWLRYSLVVMNWDDGSSGEAVPTTIEFRGMQAKHTFPIGVTTLWWYAPNTSSNSRRTDAVNASHPIDLTHRASMVKRHRKFRHGVH